MRVIASARMDVFVALASDDSRVGIALEAFSRAGWWVVAVRLAVDGNDKRVRPARLSRWSTRDYYVSDSFHTHGSTLAIRLTATLASASSVSDCGSAVPVTVTHHTQLLPLGPGVLMKSTVA